MTVSRISVATIRRTLGFLQNTASFQFVPARQNTQHRVIVLPEIPKDDESTNPLLVKYPNSKFVNFSIATERHCFYGLGQAILKYEAAINQLVEKCEAGVVDFNELYRPLEEAKSQYESVWSSVLLLQLVTDKLDKDRFQKLHSRAEEASLTRYQSKAIYETVKKIMTEHSEKKHLKPEEVRILEKHLWECKFNGLQLSDKQFDLLHNQWILKLHRAKTDYNYRIMNATERYQHTVSDPNVMRDFPVDVLRAMGTDNSQPTKGPWTVTLHPYVHRQFLAYCPDRQLRYTAHLADVTRGSIASDIYTYLAPQCKEVRQLRLDQANTLGYQTFAELSMETKMAGCVENVQTMINNLLVKAKERQELELENLQSYAETRGFDDELEVFDVPYFKRKQRRTLLGMNDDDLRDFFPFPKVLDGMFKLCSSLFGVAFEEVQGQLLADTAWRPDVRLFRVVDTGSGSLLGHVYLDAYIHDDKGYAGGDKGWYAPLRYRARDRGDYLPLGALVFALPVPNYGKPSLLNFYEVEEVMRNFGNMLQHMLAESEWSEFCGKNGLEWDAIDFAGNFMSSWIYHPDVLRLMSGHWSTGEPIKDEVVDTLTTTLKHHMTGYATCEQLYRISYDLAFYNKIGRGESYASMASEMRSDFLLLPAVKNDGFPIYFTDIISGDYPAAVFCSLWARMLAADAFSAVVEASGADNGAIYECEDVRAVTAKFRRTFFAAGSSRPMAEMFRDFRGRDPSHDALLFHLGLKSVTAPKKKAVSS